MSLYVLCLQEPMNDDKIIENIGSLLSKYKYHNDEIYKAIITIRRNYTMKVAIVYDSRTHTTEKAAGFIAEGLNLVADIEVKCFNIDEVDFDYIRQSNMVIFGSPTYMASVTAKMKSWLEANAKKLDLAGKLGGAYATEQYIHGGAENAIQEMLVFMMVMGMMTYSGGAACGKPVIHLGPVGMSQDIDSFKELFVTYGKRMGEQLLKVR